MIWELDEVESDNIYVLILWVNSLMENIQTCNKCGSIYELLFTRSIMRDKDSIDCGVCGRELHKWSEAKIWEAKLIEKHENHLVKNKV